MRNPFQRKRLFAKNSSGISRRFRKNAQRPQTRERTEREKPKGIFRRKLGRTFLLVRAFFFLALFVGIILGVVSLSAFFAVQNIVLSRTDTGIQEQDIEGDLQKLLRKNLVFLNKSELEKEFLTAFPEIQEVRLEKEFPHTLHITLSSYPVAFRWICEYEKKTLSEEGKLQTNLIQEASFVNRRGMRTPSRVEEEQDIFSVYEKDPCPSGFSQQKIVVSQEFVEYLEKAKQGLTDILGKNILRAGYFRSAREIHFITEDETAFWIDFSSPLEEQLEKLRVALSVEPSLADPLDHVDLRVTNKIFYAPQQ